VSTSAPLLQRWFATLPVRSASDPYFLYSASNLGSLLALVAYPLVLEPAVGTTTQTWIWTVGYGGLALLTAACALVVIARSRVSGEARTVDHTAAAPLTARERLTWILLAFIPSSLMLGVTTHISTDVAAVPLLWVVPLALYLATFVLAFARREVIPQRWLLWTMPIAIGASTATVLGNLHSLWLIPLHLATFFIVAMVCHRELSRRRPEVAHLTEFYIWMSVGGVFGGAFNSLVAPVAFSKVLEYPLVLALAAVVRPVSGKSMLTKPPSPLLVLVPGFLLLIWGALWMVGSAPPGLEIGPLLLALVLAMSVTYFFAKRLNPIDIITLVLAGIITFGGAGDNATVLAAERSFFGVHHVIDAPDHSFHALVHGSTTHGRQQMPAGSTCAPVGYYHPANPIGQLFQHSGRHFSKVAVIGLGAGALACYATPEDHWTFYEIDPVVERIARNQKYFTYLANARGRVGVVIGDGRIRLQHASDTYDLIILDAFSSDAIPIHLLTRDALQLYFSHLAPDGVVAVHISNIYLDLEPQLAALAREQQLFALANKDTIIPKQDTAVGRFPSHWVMLARTSEPLQALIGKPGWRAPDDSRHVRVWTDDYSNILQALIAR
jgi:spermidine synthase